MKEELLEDALIALKYLMDILDWSGEGRFVTIKLTPEFLIPVRDILKRAEELKK